MIVTANVEHVVTLRENAAFRLAYARASARTLDGMPLVWLAKLRGYETAQRVTGHDLLEAVFATACDGEDRIYMVAANHRTGTSMLERFRTLGIAPDRIAYSVPPLGFEHDPAFGETLAAEIRHHGTTLLLMGVGAPKSEIWVDQQGAALASPVTLCVGDALNVAAGTMTRAPRLMQRAGLEWFYRFTMQPRRLFRRYFVRSWRFILLASLNRNLAGIDGRTGGAP